MAERVPAVLGLDLGTSEAKAALVALDGRLLESDRPHNDPMDDRHRSAPVLRPLRNCG